MADPRLSLARDGCQLADESPCTALAASLALAFETGSAEQAGDHAASLERVCDRQHAVVCAELAEALASGPQALRDPARVSRLKERACTYGYPFACPDPGMGPPK